MPMHDWTRVLPGIFHAFHHEWISEISRALNRGLLPRDYYALPDQVAFGLGPDVLALQGGSGRWNGGSDDDHGGSSGGPSTALLTRPQTRTVVETEEAFYCRKKSSVAIRHSSDDRIVAMLEIVSPGNKSNRHALRAFVDKACELHERRIHLLVVDPFPPGPRDPEGIHAEIWNQIEEGTYEPPADQPLTFVSYECETLTRAYIEAVSVGQPLPDMPLFLEPNGCVMVPLEATYSSAFDVMPQRWKSVLE